MEYKLLILVLLFAFLGISCNEDKSYYSNGSFLMHSASDIGIDFKNTLHELKRHNALTYETFYSGGGVAIGDVNNDGLKDIYFSGNQVADALYLNKGNWQFEDVTLKSGILNDGSWSTGVTMVDINQDGWLDIYVCKSLYDEKPDLRKNKCYINQGNGKFIDQAAQLGLDDVWRTQEACFFDYDNDSDLDVLMVNQPPNPGPLSPLKGGDYRLNELGVRFLENDNGKYVDQTEKVGMAHAGYALSASITDFNNDGWLDLYIAHDYNSPDKLYINSGKKSFINSTDESCKQISFFSMGTDAADINNDGLEDFVVADMVASDPYRNKANMGGMDPSSFWKVVEDGGNYQYMYNALQINTGTQKSIPLFSNISQIAGVSKTDWSWSPLIADFNNDGQKDVFISNGIKRDLRFTDGVAKINDILNRVKKQHNIGQAEILDYVDAKKLLENLPSSKLKNYIFKNLDGVNFKEVMTDWGLDQVSFSNGSAVGDLDNDGDLDLVVNNVDDLPFIYENKISNNNYLRLEVYDSAADSVLMHGVKASVFVDGDILTSTMKTNHGFYSCSENTLHFGLGQKTKVDSILIFWDNNDYSVMDNIKINDLNRIYKTNCKLERRSTFENQKLSPIQNKAHALNLSVSQEPNFFDDYTKQVLLPYQLSARDVPFAITDLNNDKKQDILFGNLTNGNCSIHFQSDNSFNDENEVRLLNNHAASSHLVQGDFDSDGDLDIYVSCGGNRYENGHNAYRNYFLLNDGNGEMKYVLDTSLKTPKSTSVVESLDFDSDGDLDLLLTSKYIPGQYPKSTNVHFLRNDSENGQVKFVDISEEMNLESVGLVNDIIVTDIDNDGDDDVFMVGEWMPVTVLENTGTGFNKNTIANTVGWWMTAAPLDFNGDGRKDFLVGNLGDNAKYKHNDKYGFSTYYDDFDQNGKSDIVLAYEKSNQEFPVRGRSCSSEQLPDLKEKFPSYHQFASNDLLGIYGEQLSHSNKIEIDDFSSVLLENKGKMQFDVLPLPTQLQLSTIKTFYPLSENRFLCAGNMNFMEIETPKIDASNGVIFTIDDNGVCHIEVENVSSHLGGQIESIQSIMINEQKHIIYLPVGDTLKVIEESF